MNVKSLLLKLIKMNNAIESKAEKKHTHSEYYTKEEIDEMFKSTLSYDIVSNLESSKKDQFSNNK